jgi:S-formylglutathione hydrolase
VVGADDAWDFGTGAGFYLDATQAPWAPHWRMESYITQELPALLAERFAVPAGRLGLMGHSMGGHGALTLALRHTGLFASVSAVAPIAAPMQCPWGVKAFSGYLGADRTAWAAHDASALIAAGHRAPPLLVDQGLADKFLAEQLHPHRLEAACRDAGQPLALRRHAGCDHGYYFIASVMEDHLRHHAAALV